MASDIQSVLKTLNVFSVTEVTESVLIAKLHKNPMAKIVISLLNLVEKNIDLCKSAAGKMDEMKSEKIADQKKIIEIQHGQINSVQETVKSEMKSWADVVQKNTAQRSGKLLTENSVKQAVRTVNEEKKRSKNLMIYGHPESDKDIGFELNKAAKDIIEGTGALPAPRFYEVCRIGRKE